LSQSMGNLAVSTSQGNTSPQLPSPASGASSGGSTRNGVDQNPPINTLYVGNLPTSPPPAGMPPDALEASLRDLFQSRPGFRRLSFKQKSSGPMCFVEFEDVQYATKTLNELYGHNLNGLVKGGGIRLSYSKNPLGVRTTPTTATNCAPQSQQPPPPPPPPAQVNGHYSLQEDRPMIRRGVVPPPLSAQYPPPPPRFSASATALGPVSATVSSNVTFDTPLSSAPLTSLSDFIQQPLEHHRSNMYAYSLTPSSSFSPFSISASNPSPLLNHLSSHSTIPDQETDQQTRNVPPQHYQYNPRALSPPHTLEAARAG
jgi:RNA recognition motif-containing protein